MTLYDTEKKLKVALPSVHLNIYSRAEKEKVNVLEDYKFDLATVLPEQGIEILFSSKKHSENHKIITVLFDKNCKLILFRVLDTKGITNV